MQNPTYKALIQNTILRWKVRRKCSVRIPPSIPTLCPLCLSRQQPWRRRTYDLCTIHDPLFDFTRLDIARILLPSYIVHQQALNKEHQRIETKNAKSIREKDEETRAVKGAEAISTSSQRFNDTWLSIEPRSSLRPGFFCLPSQIKRWNNTPAF